MVLEDENLTERTLSLLFDLDATALSLCLAAACCKRMARIAEECTNVLEC